MRRISICVYDAITAHFAVPSKEWKMLKQELSEKETEVVLYATRGLKTCDIARTLHISEATVKDRKTAIMQKHAAPNFLRACILELHRIGMLRTLP